MMRYNAIVLDEDRKEEEKMAIKTQYIASDGTPFDDEELAKDYEESLNRAKDMKKHYHVVLAIQQDYYVDAFNEDDAADIVVDGWTTGSLECAAESYYGLETYEED